MDTVAILKYLAQLEGNNERVWYHANKVQYKEAYTIFENLLQELIFGLAKTDASIIDNIPKESTFRLMRDVRYSHDKSPYNPSFRSHISSGGKCFVPVGYFVNIKPFDRSFIGGGLFSSSWKDATKMIRDYIVANSKEWQQIITAPSFTKNFAVLGEKLKNVPRDYDKEHPQAEYLKYKSWYVQYDFTDDTVANADKFLEIMIEKFELIQPFNAFINKALVDFEMPVRPR